jgi:hypothetical protein
MTPYDLRTKIGALAQQHDAELDAVEKELRGKYRLLRRAVVLEAGEETCVNAEMEEAWDEFNPRRSEVPAGAPIVEYD